MNSRNGTYLKIVFENHGQYIQGRTRYYNKIWRSYHVGDVIPIKYYVNRAGIVMALIMKEEDERERRTSYNPKTTKMFWRITVGLLVFAGVLVVHAVVVFFVR